ncbi:hypothetical protein O0544_03370 [Edwardsiella anguillarum]|nr:hypothetical protein [Edwardsiella anguillarum]
MDALSRYQINQLLLNRLIGGDEIETLYRQIRAAGALPLALSVRCGGRRSATR